MVFWFTQAQRFFFYPKCYNLHADGIAGSSAQVEVTLDESPANG